MGLLSGLSEALFGDPSEDIQRAADEQQQFLRQALQYQRRINRQPLRHRNRAMRELMGFYSGDPEVQQQFIERAQESPFYESMIQQGQEGVLRNAGAMGLSRSGNAASALNRSNQAVLQNLVNQQLSGLQGFAGMPISGQGVANTLAQMGNVAGQSGIAQAQASQGMLGNMLGGVLGGFGLAGDLGWSPFS